MKNLIKLMTIVLFSSLLLTACNTVSGVGRDIKAAGSATGNALEKASNATANGIKGGNKSKESKNK